MGWLTAPLPLECKLQETEARVLPAPHSAWHKAGVGAGRQREARSAPPFGSPLWLQEMGWKGMERGERGSVTRWELKA